VISTPDGCGRTLVLGGGNALGAYHLGVCEALLDALAPDRIIGTSIGGITGAILAGNPPERRLDRLRAFWRQATRPGPPPDWNWDEGRARESVYAGLAALLGGRPGLFHGGLSAFWPQLVPGLPARGLNDHSPLARTLSEHLDFDLLHLGEPELHFPTIEMDTGREVWFDSRTDRIGPEHLLACTALPPLFPAVEIDGRLLCDAGLANNTPVDRAFALAGDRPLLCVAVDLFSLEHGRPSGLNGTVARAQDLVFAGQTRRTVEAIGRERVLARRLDPETPPAVLARIAFRAPDHQRGLKALDFSRASIDERIAQGRRDAEALLARLADLAWDEPFADIAARKPPAASGA
jgi:NTE family protein